MFNMGVGFCVVVGPQEVDKALASIAGVGGQAQPIGEVAPGPQRLVYIDQHRLVGEGNRFSQIGGR